MVRLMMMIHLRGGGAIREEAHCTLRCEAEGRESVRSVGAAGREGAGVCDDREGDQGEEDPADRQRAEDPELPLKVLGGRRAVGDEEGEGIILGGDGAQIAPCAEGGIERESVELDELDDCP